MTILELTQSVMNAVGFDGAITHDLTKPDGTPRKLMDGSRLQALGWTPSITLEEGLRRTVETFRLEFSDDIAKP